MKHQLGPTGSLHGNKPDSGEISDKYTVSEVQAVLKGSATEMGTRMSAFLSQLLEMPPVCLVSSHGQTLASCCSARPPVQYFSTCSVSDPSKAQTVSVLLLLTKWLWVCDWMSTLNLLCIFFYDWCSLYLRWDIMLLFLGDLFVWFELKAVMWQLFVF